MLCATVAVGAAENDLWAAGPTKRARPPKFSESVTDVFFPDARKQLVGPRPAKKPVASKTGETERPGGSALASGGTWSKLISAEAMEDEIKIQQIALGASLQNPAKFKAGEYQRSRMHFSVLAALFAINAQYGQDVRWQREAPAMRDLMARGGSVCKTPADDAYREAKARAEELESLVRGGSIASRAATTQLDWAKVAERGPLMKRLELAQQQGLSPGTASSAEFLRNADKLSHEAQLIAALAEVIARDGYEFSDDETYREYAQAMQAGALGLRAAIDQKDYKQARGAVDVIGKACGNCHDGFRN